MSNNPASKKEWQDLKAHADDIRHDRINDYFSSNPVRAKELSLSIEGLFYDFSKNHITSKTRDILCTLAKSQDVESARDDLFSGKVVNKTEDKAALHTSLRDGSQDLTQLEKLSEKIRNRYESN